MDLLINKEDILSNPVVEHTIASFGSVTKGVGRLNVLTDLITKKVSFKVIGNTGETITQSLDEAIALYNLIGR